MTVFLWCLIPFSGGFRLVLPEHIQQSTEQPPCPQRSVGSPTTSLLAQCWEINATASGLALGVKQGLGPASLEPSTSSQTLHLLVPWEVSKWGNKQPE